MVSIQAFGATNLDVPAEIVFPNLDNLAPGEKTSIFSFDHDQGRWKIVGTATVSGDGKRVTSDGGVIQASGWHTNQAGTRAAGRFANFNQNSDSARVTIFGTNQLFPAEGGEARITVGNGSDSAVIVKAEYDSMSSFTKTRIDQALFAIQPGEDVKTIIIAAPKISADDVAALQDDNGDTNHAEIRTGTVTVTATADGKELAKEKFLYGQVIAEGGTLKFPKVSEEENSTVLQNETKSLVVRVTGPTQQVAYVGDSDITRATGNGSDTFTVSAAKLVDPQQQPSGQLTLSDGEEVLPSINLNAADAIQLNPFAIRRVSGSISDGVGENFSINGVVEVGLAGATFKPLFKINGAFEVAPDALKLNGSITTDLLKDISGFGTDVVLIQGTVFEIDRATKKFKFFPRQAASKDAAPPSNAFKLAGLRFELTDIFLPETGLGLGLRGKNHSAGPSGQRRDRHWFQRQLRQRRVDHQRRRRFDRCEVELPERRI